ncbi:MAG: hypothetical protein H6Q59_954 [Firmicutes bacterium]|nr:hypothetical protein [Bacillota bacterium]
MGRIKYGIKPRHQRNMDRLSYRALFIVLLLLPVLYVTGLQLNKLSTQRLLQRTLLQGVNYDAFREMKLSSNVLEDAQVQMTKVKFHHSLLDRGVRIDPFAYLTFSMFTSSFDLTKGRLADQDLFLSALGQVGKKQGFVKLMGYYKAVLADLEYFPVPRIQGDKADISFVDTWSELRSYGGNRRHEGTDIMAKNNIRGYYPVISITEGVVEKMGWLEQGGYRIGIRSPSGGYFYYAHLNSYSEELEEGDQVLAGQLLGFMGDSGYGKEGTVGQFDVHLHLGIYVETGAGELSVNPYYILKLLEKNRLTYQNLR